MCSRITLGFAVSEARLGSPSGLIGPYFQLRLRPLASWHSYVRYRLAVRAVSDIDSCHGDRYQRHSCDRLGRHLDHGILEHQSRTAAVNTYGTVSCSADKPISALKLTYSLNGLWRRGAWLSYFFLIVSLTFITFLIAHLFAKLLASRASYSPMGSPTIDLPPVRTKPPHPVIDFFKRSWRNWRRIENAILGRMEVAFARADDVRLTWLQGICWACAGGSLAGLCLVFTKAIVKIVGNPGHPVCHHLNLIHQSFLLTMASSCFIPLRWSLFSW